LRHPLDVASKWRHSAADDKECDMDRDANATESSEPTQPTPTDDLPDKPSQAEGDVGDDQLSDGAR
jgi:hypothetical protein